MAMRGAWIAVLAGVLGCSPKAAPTVAPTPDPAVDARISALEERIEMLEREREAPPVAAPAAPGWSCMAKCGERDRQTTEFHVTFRRVTGHGASAAAAYQALIDECDGTLYERIEDERFVGGEMRSVCLAD